MHHITELKIPLASGLLQPADVWGDLYNLVGNSYPARRSNSEITLYKNRGGAHLDLMTACYIAQALQGLLTKAVSILLHHGIHRHIAAGRMQKGQGRDRLRRNLEKM